MEASGDRQGRPNVPVIELASENIVGEPRTHELLGGQIGHHELLSKALVGDLGGK